MCIRDSGNTLLETSAFAVNLFVTMNLLAKSIVTDLLLRSVWWDKKNMVLKRRLGKKTV